MGESWHEIVPERDVPEEGKLTAVVNGWHIFVVRTEDGIRIYKDRCTHAASTPSTGRIRRGAVMCPLHGARFELTSGRCIGGAYRYLTAFGNKVGDGVVHALIPDREPGMSELPTART